MSIPLARNDAICAPGTPNWWQQSMWEGAGLARIACEVSDAVSRQQQEPTSVAA